MKFELIADVHDVKLYRATVTGGNVYCVEVAVEKTHFVSRRKALHAFFGKLEYSGQFNLQEVLSILQIVDPTIAL